MKRRWWALPLGIMLAAFLAAFAADQWSVGQLARAKARARAVGLAVQASDLMKPPPDPSVNAADDYQYADSVVKSLSPDARRTVSGYVPTSAQSLLMAFGTEKGPSPVEVTAALSEWKAALRIVEQGTAKDQVVWKRDWTKSYDVVFPEYASIKMTVRALMMRAERALQQRDVEGAMHQFEVAERLCRHLYRERLILAPAVGMACFKIVYAQAGYLARYRNADFDRKILAFLDHRHTPDLRESLAAHTFIAIDFVPEYAKKSRYPGMDNPPNPWLYKALRSGFVQRGVQIRILERYRALMLGLPKDPNDLGAVRKAVVAFNRSFDEDLSIMGQITNMTMADRIMVDLFVYEQEVRRRAAKIQVALEERYEPGHWPSTLPKSIQQEDPWSGKLLKYRRDLDGYRIYSVGENGIDDGGESGAGLDVVIIRKD